MNYDEMTEGQRRAQFKVLELDFSNMKGRFCEHHETPGAVAPGCPACGRDKLKKALEEIKAKTAVSCFAKEINAIATQALDNL